MVRMLFLSFWLASLNYLMMTVTLVRLRSFTMMVTAGSKVSQHDLSCMRRVWVAYVRKLRYIVELLTDAPREVPGSNNTRFIWEGYSYMDPKMMRHYNGCSRRRRRVLMSRRRR